MHATHILDKHLRTHCQETHERRMDAVVSMVNALLHGRVLTVTGLGRSLHSEVAPKHQIKKADRLIGNWHLHHERKEFYRALILLTVGNMKQLRGQSPLQVIRPHLPSVFWAVLSSPARLCI